MLALRYNQINKHISDSRRRYHSFRLICLHYYIIKVLENCVLIRLWGRNSKKKNTRQTNMQERQIIATATEQSKQLKFMVTLMLCRIELHSLVLVRPNGIGMPHSNSKPNIPFGWMRLSFFSSLTRFYCPSKNVIFLW